MIKIYGIKNCDTVKKSLKWLAENNIEYQFHDYKKDGVDEVQLQKFIEKFGWQKVLNLKSRTWRSLSDEEKPVNQIAAIALMKEKSSIIKRPIIDSGSIQLLGFDEGEYRKAFNK
jgi:Spx/MgsR family transcriptional regulator